MACIEFKPAVSVKPLNDLFIEVEFENGRSRLYDMSPLLSESPAYSELADREFFNRASVDGGGYGIVWSDDVDLAAEEVWLNGTPA